MALCVCLILCLTILVVDLDATSVENLREQIISEVKGYFDKELEALKRKHDTELATVDARLTKNEAEIADLRSQNELLSNGLRKVLFTVESRCMGLCQSFRGEEKHKSGGIRKMSEAQTPLQEPMKVSKGFQGRDRGYVEAKKENASIFSLNSAVTIGQVLSKSGIKNQFRDKKRQVNTPMSGYGVAFSALLESPFVNTNANQDIVFDKIITNIGGAFHNSSSLFVAPVPGVYVFSFSIIAQGQHAHVKLVKNGNLVALANLNAWDQSSQLVVLQLNKGDDVAVRNDDIAAINFNGYLYSSFAGFLLYDYSDGAPIVGK